MQHRWRLGGKWQTLLIGVILFIGMYCLLIWGIRTIGLDTLQQAIAGLGVWAPIAFILLCTLTVVLAPINTTSLFVTAGLLFGHQIGFTLGFFSLILGSGLNFWISRRWGRHAAAQLIGHKSLDRLDQFTAKLTGHRNWIMMVAALMLSQDLVSYAFGLTRVRFRQFLTAAMVSGGLTVAMYVYLGTGVVDAMARSPG